VTLAIIGDVRVFPPVSHTRIRQILGMMQAHEHSGTAERFGRGRGDPMRPESEPDERIASRTLIACV